MKRILFPLLLAALMALVPAAMAESCFTIDVDVLDMDSLRRDDYVAAHLSASAQGVRVTKYISQSSEVAASVRLTLTEMENRSLIFDKDYGFCSGTFDSGVIYLPYRGDRTIPYLVTLYVGDYVYAMPFMHLQARLSYNGACTSGVRLRDLSASLGGDWLMGTMIDLNDLRSDGYRSIDLCASNQYVVGTAHVYMNGSELSVDVDFASSADVEINQSTVYVATDCAAFAKGQYPAAHDLGEWISVGGADSALLYLPMQISYNPAGLSSFYYNADAVRRQISLWEANQSRNRSSDFVPVQPKADDGWSDDGWSSGWGSTEGWVEGAGWD